MIARYNNMYYRISKGRAGHELLTRIKEKAQVGFQYDRPVFYKKVDLSDNNLSDVFNLDIWVHYDTGLPNVPVEWKIDIDTIFLKKEHCCCVLWRESCLGGTSRKRMYPIQR